MRKFQNKYFLIKYLMLIPVLSWPFLNAASQSYFQQETNYKIHVTLNDVKHELNGFESIDYINNSPDTLMFLYFHLWPNAYSNNKTALARQIFNMKGKAKLFNDEELRGYIDSLDFEADGEKIKWYLLPESPDICMINFNEPLNTGDTVIITTPFHVKIPEGVTSRLGHIGESYQISQWYPKPAVYDRSGWHQMPYLDQAEFYSEFGRFEVSITLPSNYIVGATGILQNEDEKRFLDKLASDPSSGKAIYYREADFPPSSKEIKTLNYIENNIHDFAWFADKRFHVLKGRVKLPCSGREVTTYAMFTNKEAHLWWNALSYINSAISYFSGCIGDYPYDVFTAVQSTLNSGAGMEYPGLTVIGPAGDPYLLDQVIAHEICHSWFYSSLGSDERRFPFMDESIASAYESRYLNEKYPDKKLWELSFRNRKLAEFLKIDEIPAQRIGELEWLVPARRNQELPVNLAATDYNSDNYGSIIYSKAAQGFNYLRAYLGDSLFDTIIHDYYGKWKNKHPQPEDLRAVFEENTAKDLEWFFDDFLGTTKRLDYKIIRSENNRLLIKNNGELNGPFYLMKTKGDIVNSVQWEDGFNGKKWIDVPWTDESEIVIDPDHVMPELFRLNNNIHTSGIWPKADPVKLRFLYTIEEPENNTLVYFPALDWNKDDGLMAGLALNNGTLIPKPVEYLFIPFYTFRNNGVTGYGRISFNIIPYNNPVRIATFTFEGAQFGTPGNQNYRKGKIGLDLAFRSRNNINPVNHEVFAYFLTASDLPRIKLLMDAKMRSYLQFGYIIERSGLVNPFNILISSESGVSFHKTTLDLNYLQSYYGKNNGLGIRLFAGTMLKDDAENPFYSLSAGGRSGSEQYLYKGLYPDRFGEPGTGFWARQMDLSEGGLISPVNYSLGYSRWLVSLSLTSSLPEKISWIPVKPFLNALLNDHSVETVSKSQLFFEAGFKAGIWNFFEIYLPLLVSDNIESITGSFKDRIRFVFRLDLLNPVKSK
jgi:hypothetical protein